LQNRPFDALGTHLAYAFLLHNPLPCLAKGIGIGKERYATGKRLFGWLKPKTNYPLQRIKGPIVKRTNRASKA